MCAQGQTMRADRRLLRKRAALLGSLEGSHEGEDVIDGLRIHVLHGFHLSRALDDSLLEIRIGLALNFL